MFEIYIGNAFDPKKVIVSGEKTVREVYEENHVSLLRDSVVTHGQSRLGDNELDRTLSELGVVSGDLITCTQKLNGAR